MFHIYIRLGYKLNLILLNYNDEIYNLPFLGLPIVNMFMTTILYLTSQLSDSTYTLRCNSNLSLGVITIV